ncbi:hypothetical protein DSC45_28365 [Streptomyces sp. YIM 130001]|nr:hypothetical protein DSC45_28365 [Streptomyces sp. YIM 130001]
MIGRVPRVRQGGRSVVVRPVHEGPIEILAGPTPAGSGCGERVATRR